MGLKTFKSPNKIYAYKLNFVHFYILKYYFYGIIIIVRIKGSANMNNNINVGKKHSNILFEIIMIPFFIIKYFFIGCKFIFIDTIKSLFKPHKDSQVNPKLLDKLNKKKILLEKELSLSKREKKGKLYQYIAIDKENNVVKDTMNGLSKNDIYTYLTSLGYTVYSIKSSFFIDAMYKQTNIGTVKMSNKNLTFFLTQLSTYIKAGLTLNEAVKIVQEQMKVSKYHKSALKSLTYELTLGESFSTALEHQKDVFPNLLINMIKAAEASGTLEQTLEDMANYYSEIDTTRKQMINAITYPCIILVFSIFVVIFIMLYVVPQFERIYASSDANITGLTLILINVSNFIKANIFYILSIFVIIILSLVLLYKYNKQARKFLQTILMNLPIIKNLIIYNELTIFAITFASLLKNNVYITDSIDLLGQITSNEIYKEIFSNTITNIVKGDKISDSFKNHWAIPDVAYYMIVTGENTGQLPQMMQKVGEYYQEQHKAIVNSFKSLVEPILITILAIIVGVIVIVVIVPMFDIYGTIN